MHTIKGELKANISQLQFLLWIENLALSKMGKMKLSKKFIKRNYKNCMKRKTTIKDLEFNLKEMNQFLEKKA